MTNKIDMTIKSKYGLLLLNMGGPRHPDEIEKYLYNLFSDPLIIELPFFLRCWQKRFARLISKRRSRKVASRYLQIGGKSPLENETKRMVSKLEELLQIPVSHAMRYISPSVNDAINYFTRREVSELVVIPLYPQYSKATTQSAINDFLDQNSNRLIYHIIENHHLNSGYIKGLADLLRNELKKIKPEAKSHILFVAHSIPHKYVKKGDPYVQQIRETVDEVYNQTDTAVPFLLAFQSKMGPVRWQGPSLEESLEYLVPLNIKQLIVQPVSFVLENLETLYDLDIVFKNHCIQNGIKDYFRVPVIGLHADYLNALSQMTKLEINNGEKKND